MVNTNLEPITMKTLNSPNIVHNFDSGCMYMSTSEASIHKFLELKDEYLAQVWYKFKTYPMPLKASDIMTTHEIDQIGVYKRAWEASTIPARFQK